MSMAVLKKIELLENSRKKQKVVIELKGNSCGLFSPKNKLRQICKSIVEYKHFDNIVLMLIGISTILLTLDNPLNDENGQLSKTLSRIDYVMTTLFTIECILNVIVRGFISNGPTSYL